MMSLWAYYFYIKRRWTYVALFTLAVALFKEDAWILAGAMAFYFFSEQKKWIPAVLSFFIGFVVFASYGIFFNKINSLSDRYGYLGHNFSETLPILAKNPFIFFQHLMTPEPLHFLGSVLILGGGFWLLGGWAIIAVLPTLFECALSTSSAMHNFDSHYAIAFMGPLLFATAKGFQKIDTFKITPFKKKVLLILGVGIALSQLRYSEPVAIKDYLQSKNWKNRECLLKLVEKIPSGAPVYAQDPLVAHLSKRPLLFPFPNMNPEYLPKSWIAAQEGALIPPGFKIVEKDCGQVIARLVD
jgi:uncharacterized membrane protein